MALTLIGKKFTMPQRANLFQDVVAIVQGIINPGADVERSAMIKHDQTGDPREVDMRVIIESPRGDLSVGVESTSLRRKANVQWVEQQVGKHAHLGTDQIVLVSDSGFTKAALRLAGANNVVTVTPTDIEEGSARAQIVGRVPTLFPRTLELGIDLYGVVVDIEDMSKPFAVPVEPSTILRIEDGRPVGSVRKITELLLDAKDGKAINDAGLLRGTEGRSATTVLPIPAPRATNDEGQEIPMWVDLTRWGKPYPKPVRAIVARTSYHLRVGKEVALRHRRISEVNVAYGEIKAFGETFTIVASASKGVERFDMEIRERGGKEGAFETTFNAFPRPLDPDDHAASS